MNRIRRRLAWILALVAIWLTILAGRLTDLARKLALPGKTGNGRDDHNK